MRTLKAVSVLFAASALLLVLVLRVVSISSGNNSSIAITEKAEQQLKAEIGLLGASER